LNIIASIEQPRHAPLHKDCGDNWGTLDKDDREDA